MQSPSQQGVQRRDLRHATAGVGAALVTMAMLLSPNLASASDVLPVFGTSYQNAKSFYIGELNLPLYFPTHLARTYADFNGDGRLDLFAAPGEPYTGPFMIWIQAPDGQFNPDPQIIRINGSCVHSRTPIVADFNGDGHPDVFVACHGKDSDPFPGETNKVMLSQPDGTYIVSTPTPDVGFFHGAAAADLNGDGRVDVLLANSQNPQSVTALINTGGGHFRSSRTPVLPKALRGAPYFTLALVDANGDGKVDLLAGGHEFEGAKTVLLLNPGNNNFAKARPIVIPPVEGEGVILDFVVTESGKQHTLWVLRTSGGDGTFYRGRALQKVDLGTLTYTVPLNDRTKSWVPWIVPTTLEGRPVIASDVPQMKLQVDQH